MIRWVVFFIFIFITGNILASVIEGGGFAVTRLDGDLTAVSATITVDSTVNFLEGSVTHPAYVTVGGVEVCSYTAKTTTTFTGVTRGATDPQTGYSAAAVAHSDDSRVESVSVSAISSIMAINMVTSEVSWGSLAGYIITGSALTDLWKTLTWDYPWFGGVMILPRFILMAFSVGFLWGLAMAMMALAQGIWSRVT